jgi:hypothetical protein
MIFQKTEGILMAETTNTSEPSFPRQKVFEANFPMHDHVCDARTYRLDRKEDTGRQIGGKNVVKYVFILVEQDELD